MPLSASTMAADVVNAVKAMNPNVTGQALTDLTNQWQAICGAIINRIKADAVVTTPSGVAVATTGSATAQTGATTAPGTGTIS